jgi:formylglycine-generating enzyme required for sulfatase activity
MRDATKFSLIGLGIIPAFVAGVTLIVVALVDPGAVRWWYSRVLVRPNLLNVATELALKPTESFKECADCPEMIVVPAGSFMMGSGNQPSEEPQHEVTIAKPFAVSKFEQTFTDWDACADYGDCDRHIQQYRPLRLWNGRWPAIVTWDEAKSYAAWLSRMTGKPYRLLSEAEYEYAARAGTQTAYPWGDEIGKGDANCNGCDSMSASSETAPVGSFAPNWFGLYDMVGNVWEWVEDCEHENYHHAPTDGSAWIEGDRCNDPKDVNGVAELPDHLDLTGAIVEKRSSRAVRGGLPFASRRGDATIDLNGFRVGRSLTPGSER